LDSTEPRKGLTSVYFEINTKVVLFMYETCFRTQIESVSEQGAEENTWT